MKSYFPASEPDRSRKKAVQEVIAIDKRGRRRSASSSFSTSHLTLTYHSGSCITTAPTICAVYTSLLEARRLLASPHRSSLAILVCLELSFD